jgi:hypothetical protein
MRALSDFSFAPVAVVTKSEAVMQGAAHRDAAPDKAPKVNTHVHLPPNFSAFQAVKQAVELAAAAELQVLGTSNYYDFGVYSRLAESAHAQSVFPLFGLELIQPGGGVEERRRQAQRSRQSRTDVPMRKGFTRFAPTSGEARRLIKAIRDADRTRIEMMIERVTALMQHNGVYTSVTAEAVRSSPARRCAVPVSSVYLQKRHVARLSRRRYSPRSEGQSDPFGGRPHATIFSLDTGMLGE